MALLTVIYERQCAVASSHKHCDNNSKHGVPSQRRLLERALPKPISEMAQPAEAYHQSAMETRPCTQTCHFWQQHLFLDRLTVLFLKQKDVTISKTGYDILG